MRRASRSLDTLPNGASPTRRRRNGPSSSRSDCTSRRMKPTRSGCASSWSRLPSGWSASYSPRPPAKRGGRSRLSARRLDGVACAAQIRNDVAPRITAFVQRHGRPPGLGVVLAGRNPASEVYVRNKIKTVGDAGCRAELFRLDDSATLSEALALVRKLNADEGIDGILVQSPLPEGMGKDAEQR